MAWQAELPGGAERDLSLAPQTVIIGPEIERIELTGRWLRFLPRSGGQAERVTREQVQELVIIGDARLDWRDVLRLVEDGVGFWQMDEWGRLRVELSPPADDQELLTIQGQMQLLADPAARLNLARSLIEAKLYNYAVLSQRYHTRHRDLASKLFRLARSVLECVSLEELSGLEGSGAARWYGRLGVLLAKDFHFERRIAPEAADPVNAMLNIAHTIMHRLLRSLLHSNRLLPAAGILHQQRVGHAALASDLQECFRHLMDRAVIEATRVIRASEFRSDPGGPYPLRIMPRALQKFLAIIYRLLAIPVHGHWQSEPQRYRRQMHLMVRSFKLHCQDREHRFRPFRHP